MSTLTVPDGSLYFEVRGQGPLLAMVGAPMHADAFAPIAELMATDHTVLTMDPRGINRSPLNDPEMDTYPEQRADDLARVLAHIDAGPATVFGSSGGAVAVLALAQTHTPLVHTVIAHEPPHYEQLDDREKLFAKAEEMIADYAAGDPKAAWATFMEIANIHLPEGALEHFMTEPGSQDAADERYSFLHMMRGTTRWVPDLAALRDGQARVMIGLGEDSAGELCDRSSRALSASLGIEPTMFPGGHIGFAEDPEPFAARLREVL